MTEKTTKKTEKPVTDKKAENVNEVKPTEVKTSQPSKTSRVAVWSRAHRRFLSGVAIAVVLAGLMAGSYALGARAGNDDIDSRETFTAVGDRMLRQGEGTRMSPPSDRMGGGFGGPGRGGMYGEETSTSGSRIGGVVTAVDGDTITIAGGGMTAKVTVQDDTRYTGSDGPAEVNDTIVASGTRQSDGSLLASVIRLDRQ